MKIVTLNEQTKQNLLESLLKRSTNDYGEYEKIVDDIIQNVKTRKEEAIFEYSLKFDKCELTKESFKVTRDEIDAAYNELDEHFIQVMRDSAANIRSYHEKQKRNSWFDAKEDGTILGQKITPMQTVGVYVPGGKAAYPSTTLMNVVPAKVAGVPNIVMTTPANAEGKVKKLLRYKGEESYRWILPLWWQEPPIVDNLKSVSKRSSKNSTTIPRLSSSLTRYTPSWAQVMHKVR